MFCFFKNRATVPNIISIEPEDIEIILSSSRDELRDVVLSLIEINDLTLYKKLANYVCFDITIPESYKYASRINIRPEQRKLNGYSVCIDTKKHRLFTTFWNGSK